MESKRKCRTTKEEVCPMNKSDEVSPKLSGVALVEGEVGAKQRASRDERKRGNYPGFGGIVRPEPQAEDSHHSDLRLSWGKN